MVSWIESGRPHAGQTLYLPVLSLQPCFLELNFSEELSEKAHTFEAQLLKAF